MDDQDEAEYVALRYASDPIEAFNLFVKRNVPAELHAHFADSDDNEAEYVRRAIRAAMVPQVVAAVGGAAGGGNPTAARAATTWFVGGAGPGPGGGGR